MALPVTRTVVSGSGQKKKLRRKKVPGASGNSGVFESEPVQSGAHASEREGRKSLLVNAKSVFESDPRDSGANVKASDAQTAQVEGTSVFESVPVESGAAFKSGEDTSAPENQQSCFENEVQESRAHVRAGDAAGIAEVEGGVFESQPMESAASFRCGEDDEWETDSEASDDERDREDSVDPVEPAYDDSPYLQGATLGAITEEAKDEERIDSPTSEEQFEEQEPITPKRGSCNEEYGDENADPNVENNSPYY